MAAKKAAKKAKKSAKKSTKKAGKKKATKKKASGGRKVARKATGKKTAKKAAPKKKSTRKPNAAFMRPVQPDVALGAVVGNAAIPRTEITKKLWAYIKKNGLQDQKNKRMINADDTLSRVFGGKKSVNMFEMTKLIAKHVS